MLREIFGKGLEPCYEVGKSAKSSACVSGGLYAFSTSSPILHEMEIGEKEVASWTLEQEKMFREYCG
ncbi:hypothetical protein HPP92_012860 [Vanilla planifolia]|uniref:Uncharacterized protein n=1 Tax=Vanilla planifolia TaxID=51239 RepID=A0A835UUA3_VANPL|nr:hypothetical protein HPP92_012860 [Vanilla planifolia]